MENELSLAAATFTPAAAAACSLARTASHVRPVVPRRRLATARPHAASTTMHMRPKAMRG